MIDIINWIGIALGISLFIIFIYVSIISLFEKEKRAAFVSFVFAIFLPLPFILFSIYEFPHQEIILLALLITTAAASIALFLPINFFRDKTYIVPKTQLDERDVMFSRNELVPGSTLFNEYYKRHPEKKDLDDKFREKPGLLADDAVHFHEITFAASKANSDVMDILKEHVDGESEKRKTDFDPQKMSSYIQRWLKSIGAHSVGVTELKNYHLYTHKGRGDLYNKEIQNNHPYAIAITVEMDDDMMRSAPKGSVIMESTQQYLNVGVLALQLASFIRHLGYSAKSHVDGRYEVVCPLVARDAGLGEIGRMGLLMDPKLGPRIRIAVVTTDMPLVKKKSKGDLSMIDFCSICKKCADVCPSRSIPFEDREMIDGTKRWRINSESCFTYWTSVGTDCGKCMAFCPYSHPDNLLHNFIRWGIKNSWLFRRFALKMDDLFYGRRPTPRKLPAWIDF